MKNIYRLLRYDWPLHFVLLLTNWLPDNVVFLRLRGALARPFLGKCGKPLNLGRNVIFHNPSFIHIGDYVHLSYGCMLMATDKILIGDEVMFGPYCVIISGNHTLRDGSFRFGEAELAPISIAEGSWLGSHVTVTAGANIGSGCLVAAGAVVTQQNYSSHTLIGGVPAREIRQLANNGKR
jgi:maltose O-acetyltransferase